MSIKLMSAVWAMDLKSTHKLVLLALADNANDSGVCWPSVANICQKTSLSERCVQGSIRELCKAGFLAINPRQYSSNSYIVTPRTTCTPAPDAPPPPHDVHPTPAPRAPRTIIEPSIEPPKGLDSDAWKAWVEYRKAIRKPLRPANLLAAMKKLASFGKEQAAVVENAIAQGWQGLYPISKTSAAAVASEEWQIVRAALRDSDLRKTVLPTIVAKVGKLGGWIYLASLKPFDLEQKRKEFEALP